MAKNKGHVPSNTENAGATDAPTGRESIDAGTSNAVEFVEETVQEAVAAEASDTVHEQRIIDSVRAGALAAREAAAQFAPAVGQRIRKTAYRGIYYVSFGVTFGALAVAKLVPSDSFVGHAIADGAGAAKEAFVEHAVAAADDADAPLSPAAA